MEEHLVDDPELFDELFAAFNDRDWDLYEEYLAEDVIVHNAGEVHSGIDAFIEVTTDFTTAYPDAEVAVDEVIVQENHYAARINISAPETSKSGGPLDLAGIVHGRIEDGKIAEIWTLTD